MNLIKEDHKNFKKEKIVQISSFWNIDVVILTDFRKFFSIAIKRSGIFKTVEKTSKKSSLLFCFFVFKMSETF
jgi:hypothetical protein